MNAAKNQAKAYLFDPSDVSEHLPIKDARRPARLLKMKRKGGVKKSALPGRVRHRKASGRRGRIAAAKAISRTSLEVGPTTALCLLLLDELGL